MEPFHAALLAPQLRLCGRTLPALTLWHWALLDALHHPLLSSDRDGDLDTGQLLLALEICRAEWPRRPRTRPTLHTLYWRMRLDRSPALFAQAAAALSGWIHDHTAGPLFWRDTGKQGGGLTAPDVLSLVYGLTSLARLDHRSAWSTTPAMAQYILGAVAEINGATLQFADPDHLDHLERHPPIQPTTREAALAAATAAMGPHAAAQWIKKWDAANS